MTRIEKCEKLLEKWKADKFACKMNGDNRAALEIAYKMNGLRSALDIFKQPSNNVNTPDACDNCPHNGGLTVDCMAPAFTVCPE
jgi:hypothetical protein